MAAPPPFFPLLFYIFLQVFPSGNLKRQESVFFLFTWNDWTKLNTFSDSFRLEWSSSWRLKQQQSRFLAALQHNTYTNSQCFKQKVKSLRMLGGFSYSFPFFCTFRCCKACARRFFDTLCGWARSWRGACRSTAPAGPTRPPMTALGTEKEERLRVRKQ